MTPRKPIPPRPAILPPLVASISAELRRPRAWVAWRLALRDGRRTKEPINPVTGTLTKTDDSSTWADFPTAVGDYKRLDCGGIGLCRTDDYLFINLDGCLPGGWRRAMTAASLARSHRQTILMRFQWSCETCATNRSLLSYAHESCEQAEARIMEEHAQVNPSCLRLRYRSQCLDNVQRVGRE